MLAYECREMQEACKRCLILASNEFADKEMVLKCSTCLEYRPSNQKEPMIAQPSPTIPWDTVAIDRFYWNNSNYLLVVDYYSRYFEIAKLPDTKSSTVITS